MVAEDAAKVYVRPLGVEKTPVFGLDIVHAMVRDSGEDMCFLCRMPHLPVHSHPAPMVWQV